MNIGKVDTDSETGKDALHHGTGLIDWNHHMISATIYNQRLKHFQSENAKA